MEGFFLLRGQAHGRESPEAGLVLLPQAYIVFNKSFAGEYLLSGGLLPSGSMNALGLWQALVPASYHCWQLAGPTAPRPKAHSQEQPDSTGQLNNGNARVLKRGATIKSPTDAMMAIFKCFNVSITKTQLLTKLANPIPIPYPLHNCLFLITLPASWDNHVENANSPN